MHIQKYRRNEFVRLMIELIRLYQPKTYVEIGVGDGFTFKRLVANCPEVRRFVAVDIQPLPHIKELEIKWDDYVQVYENCSSQEFAKIWNEPIDMLFIDGDHNKETVAHDFFEIGKFVREGTGLILLHDTHPMTEELLQPQFCNNAWEFADHLFAQASIQQEYGEIVSEGPNYHWWHKYIEVLTLPGPWAGLTIVKKRGTHHLCWKNGKT